MKKSLRSFCLETVFTADTTERPKFTGRLFLQIQEPVFPGDIVEFHLIETQSVRVGGISAHFTFPSFELFGQSVYRVHRQHILPAGLVLRHSAFFCGPIRS